jgi:hypothetical protein
MPLTHTCIRKRYTEAEVGAMSEVFSALCTSTTAKQKNAHTRTLLSFIRNIQAVRSDSLRKDATLAAFSRCYSITDDEVYYEAILCWPLTTNIEGMAPSNSSSANRLFTNDNVS